MYFSLFMNSFTSFIGMYGEVYKITDAVDDLKRAIMILMVKNIREKGRRDELRLIIQSIPVLAIRSAGFHVIERESTPVFVDYVFQQITGLLLAF